MRTNLFSTIVSGSLMENTRILFGTKMVKHLVELEVSIPNDGKIVG